MAATRFNVEGARAALAANVADGYFQVRGLAIQLADARETVRIQTQLQEIAARKAQLGLGAAADADRVAGDLAQAKSNAESLEAELHANQRTLLVLVGRGIDPVSAVTPTTVAGDVPAAPDTIPGDLLQRRPDIREAEARVRSAAGRDKIAHRALFPTFTFQPSGGLSHLVSPGVTFIPPATLQPAQQTTNTSFWAYGVGVSQPVLDVPRLLADMKTQDARTEQAVIAYEKRFTDVQELSDGFKGLAQREAFDEQHDSEELNFDMGSTQTQGIDHEISDALTLSGAFDYTGFDSLNVATTAGIVLHHLGFMAEREAG